jgi:hypothetical protein
MRCKKQTLSLKFIELNIVSMIQVLFQYLLVIELNLIKSILFKNLLITLQNFKSQNDLIDSISYTNRLI